jgi:hypothetical protein
MLSVFMLNVFMLNVVVPSLVPRLFTQAVNLAHFADGDVSGAA